MILHVLFLVPNTSGPQKCWLKFNHIYKSYTYGKVRLMSKGSNNPKLLNSILSLSMFNHLIMLEIGGLLKYNTHVPFHPKCYVFPSFYNNKRQQTKIWELNIHCIQYKYHYVHMLLCVQCVYILPWKQHRMTINVSVMYVNSIK